MHVLPLSFFYIGILNCLYVNIVSPCSSSSSYPPSSQYSPHHSSQDSNPPKDDWFNAFKSNSSTNNG